MSSNLNIINDKANSKDNAYVDALESNETSKSTDDTIISSSY